MEADRRQEDDGVGTCPNCGARRRGAARFCTSCGVSLASPEAEHGPAEHEPAEHEPAEQASVEPAVASGDDAPARADIASGVGGEPTWGGPSAAPATAGPPTEVVDLARSVDLATCPSCEAVNAVERVRCARCGTVLLDEVVDDWPSDDALPLPDLDQVSTDDTASRGRRRAGDVGPRRLGVVIVVVGALVGALLASWAFGLGPFARQVGPGVAFDGEVYTGQSAALVPASATSSSVRPATEDRTFTAAQAVDGDLETAWVTTEGEGAMLTFTFPQPVWITALEVANGDQHDDEAFAATARVRVLGMDAGLGARVDATLISGPGRQGFRPPSPLLTDRIALEVVTTTDGADAALSEVTFVGFVASEADARDYAAAVA